MERTAAEGTSGGAHGHAARGHACDQCGAQGTIQRCTGCGRTVYCGVACQRQHWRGGHKRTCRATGAAAAGGEAAAPVVAAGDPPRAPGTTEATAQPAVPSAHRRAGDADADAGATGAGGGGNEVDETKPTNPCPLCLGNEDDSGNCGMCFACGQMYCGECNVPEVMGKVAEVCPTCRAPLRVSDEEQFKRTWSLVHDRSPGRHTPGAQNNLGVFCKDGLGGKQDHAAAVGWFRKAADQGYARAQFNLGFMFEKGMGVEQDPAEAARWYRKAADQGYANAQYNLAGDYARGTGVGQDHAEAVRWYRLAADQGDADAQYNLGLMHATGQGTPTDLRQAAAWWRRAAAQGHAGATTVLDKLAQWPLGMPGTPVVVTGLAASPQFNGRTGIVQGPATKPGRLAVLLDGDTKPTSIRETNLRKAAGL